MPNNVKTVPLNAPQQGGQWHTVPPVQLPPNSGEWLISFQLTGNTPQNVTFNRADPMWVRAKQKPDQANKTNPQITAMHVTSDGKELIVLDSNSNPKDEGVLPLHYQLNFNGTSALDPIIENGGGPKQVHDAYDFVTVALIAAAAFLIGIVMHWGYRKLSG
jgi:hypothetical protein